MDDTRICRGTTSRNLKLVPSTIHPEPFKPHNTAEYKDRVNTLLLVSTLIDTLTFGAGFSVPGGNNSSDPNAGMASLSEEKMYQIFVICNPIAMYTAILAANTLIWAQIGDLNLMERAVNWAMPFMGLALTENVLGLHGGVYLVVSVLFTH